MNKKLISKIFAQIKKSPEDITAYEDMFSLCRNMEQEDFKLAHSTNEKLRKSITRVIKRRENVEGFFELYKKTLLFDAPHFLDAYLLYLEINRKPEERFYQPRRKVLKRVVDALQKLVDDELDELFLALPPRVGKTSLLMFLGTWIIGRSSELSNLYCAYSDTITKEFYMYSEVIQDSVVDLIKAGHCKFASGCSLRLVESKMAEVLADLDFYRDKLLLRPQETSNSPEIARRLGIIAINTALEADIYGNVNSTHVCGTKMMNGIGGSGDFARNSYLSIFTTASTAKNGAISSIVPMVTHQDHSEHSVKVLVTEQGVADLRGKSPRQRAEEIINNCVAPEYREMLRDYLKHAKHGQTQHNLSLAFAMHEEFLKSGDMRNTKWENYLR